MVAMVVMVVAVVVMVVVVMAATLVQKPRSGNFHANERKIC